MTTHFLSSTSSWTSCLLERLSQNTEGHKESLQTLANYTVDLVVRLRELGLDLGVQIYERRLPPGFLDELAECDFLLLYLLQILILRVRSLLDIEELTRRLAKRTFWAQIALYSRDERAIHGRIRSLQKGLFTFGVCLSNVILI